MRTDGAVGPGIFLCVLFASVAAALRRGDRLDRLTGLALILATFGSAAADLTVAGTYARPETGVAIVDVLLLGFLLYVMKASSKFWPIWAVGFHSISVLTHLAVLVSPKFLSMPYAVYSEWWALPVVLALLAGCFERGDKPAPVPIRS